MKQIVWTKDFCSIGTVILALLIGPLAATARPSVDQQIQRIQNSLLPPVLVRGEPEKPTALSKRMDALHIPGVSIAVIHGGKLEWARGFGVMSIGGPPVTPETLFQAASISKPVTTLAVLKLVQAGKLNLDADVNRYLVAWKLPGNEFTQQGPVTLRGLLTHSAGVTVHGFEGYRAGEPIPSLEQVLNGESPANNPPIRVDMVPGQNGDGAVVMTNGDNGGPLIEAILRTIAHEYGWPDYAPAERTLAAVDPHSFDHYVGAYRFASGEIVTFWRDGNQIRTRIVGQRVTNMFPSSESDYFLKVVDARWVFSTDSAGQGSTAVLYQGGREQLVTRLSGVGEQAALDWSIATEKRLKEQTAAIGSEAMLRALIAGIAIGRPNYDAMTADFAETVRQQLSDLQGGFAALGAVESVSFNRVTPVGADIYNVRFEQGDREFRILLDSDGRIHGATIDASAK